MRPMMVGTRLLAAMLFILTVSVRSQQPNATVVRPPNIVVVLFDDMGYGQPGCYRAGSEFKTPNLDRLSREGMRFTDAHTACSVCTPTRYGLLTGRYPSRIGQYGVLTTFSAPLIGRQRMTVTSMLKQQGYHTACFGKWHLGMTWKPGHGKEEAIRIGTAVKDGPNAIGFDIFWGYTHSRNIGMIFEDEQVARKLHSEEVQPLLADRAVAYVDERARAGTPFFLYLPLSPPHTPIVPAQEFVGKSGAKDYGDWLYQGDWVLGQVVEALERNHLSDNTLLIATSDNGAAGRVYAPLRGCKTDIYEGGHRVPFIARWPGMVKPASVCDDTICLNDFLATFAEILKVKLPDNAAEDSVSILPDLLGTAKGPVREATVHQSPGRDLAIRQGPWKLIFLKSGKQQLYNLKDDLGERNNVLGQNPEVVAKLTKLMQQYIATGRSTPGAPQKNAAVIRLDGKGKTPPDKVEEELNGMQPDFD